MATLFHWDLPQALQDAGGWESRDVAYRFADYAEAVFDALGDAVPVWLTVNEPKTVVQNGYLYGHHAPGHRDPDAAYVVAHHLQLGPRPRGAGAAGHRLGGPDRPGAQPAPLLPRRRQRRRARGGGPATTGTRTGSTSTPSCVGGYPADVLDDLGPDSRMVRGDPRRRPRGHLRRRSTCSPCSTTRPYYVTARRRHASRAGRRPRRAGSRSTPTGMYDIADPGHPRLRRRSRSPSPRTACPAPTGWAPTARVDDAGRVRFLRDHFAAAHRAIADGVPLESYHVWSLLDNFEWNEGYDAALGPGLRRLRHPAADPQAQRALVPRR